MIIVPTRVAGFGRVTFGRGHDCALLSLTPPEMSSTLFNRGSTTQTGVRRRAEAIDKSITELRAAVSTSDETSRLVRLLEARISALERKVTTLEAANTALEAQVVTATNTTETTPTLTVNE
jgi:hypothetical protein